MKYSKEQQAAIDAIAGKSSNGQQSAEVTKAVPGEFKTQTAAVAAMMQAPEGSTPEQLNRFEKLRAVAMKEDEKEEKDDKEQQAETYAVAFDGVICEDKYPEIGEAKDDAIEKIRDLMGKGNTVILWTRREGDELQAALSWCADRNLFFTSVNSDGIKDYKKLPADHYIDGKNLDIEDL